MEGFLTVEPRRRLPFLQALPSHNTHERRRKRQCRLYIGIGAVVALAALGITLSVSIVFGYLPNNFPVDATDVGDDNIEIYITNSLPEPDDTLGVLTAVEAQLSRSAPASSSTGPVTVTSLFTLIGQTHRSTDLDEPVTSRGLDLVATSPASEAEMPTAPTDSGVQYSGVWIAASSSAAASQANLAMDGNTSWATALAQSDTTSVATSSRDSTVGSDPPTTTFNSNSAGLGADASQLSTLTKTASVVSSVNGSSMLRPTTVGAKPLRAESVIVEAVSQFVTPNAAPSNSTERGGGVVRMPVSANATRAGVSSPDHGSENDDDDRGGSGVDDGLQEPVVSSSLPPTTALAIPETACQISAKVRWPVPLVQTIPGMPTFRDPQTIHQWMDNLPQRANKLRTTVPIIVASVAHCASVGKEILLDGGSAVDGAIASQICHGFFNPMSAGIGGGFIMTLYDKLRLQNVVFDARETAPMSVNVSLYESNRSLALEGGLAIAVPNEVAGYYEAWLRYGKIPWKKLFTRTIYWCEQGFLVTQSYAETLAKNADFLRANDVLRNDFVSNGRPLTAGRLLRRPLLGRTLRRIADDALSFYTGDLAKDVLCDLEDAGAHWTRADLQRYSVKIKSGLRFYMQKNQMTAVVPPPPSLGAVLGLALKTVSAFRLTREQMLPEPAHEETASYSMHIIAESLRLAFARRNDIGDADLNEEVLQAVNQIERLDVNGVRDAIKDRKRVSSPSTYYRGIKTGDRQPAQMFDAGDIDGVHTSVTDTDGISVSISSSIGLRFGSKRVGRRTGIVFNSAMADFNTIESTDLKARVNWIAPGARPASTLVPTIIVDSSNYAQVVTGATGGERGISALAWTILNLIDLDKNYANATEQPMLHPLMVPLNAIEQRGVRQSYNSRLAGHGNDIRTMARDPRTPYLWSVAYEQFTRTATYYGNSDRRQTNSFLGQGGVA